MTKSSNPPPPPPPPPDLPPPDYAPLQPQILITPLPESASFFWGKTVQGEIYVKGLGEGRGGRIGIVDNLSVQLSLTNHLPNHPTLNLHQFPDQILYPPQTSALTNESSSTPASSGSTLPFSTAHRFSIPLPTSLTPPSSPSISSKNHESITQNVDNTPLPGTLNLTSYEKGEIKYTLSVKLVLPNGQIVNEEMRIEGTPQEISCANDSQRHDRNSAHIDGEDQAASSSSSNQQNTEVEEKLEKDGVLARLLLDQDKPRLGELLRLGVEIRPIERKKTGVSGLVKQSDPIETLRPLRRVRVELFRKVVIHSNSNGANQASSSSSSSTTTQLIRQHNGTTEHLSLLHASGKSLRYPGSGRKYPPLRVLFTIPTAQSGVVAEQTWGEITSNVPYHSTTFFVRVTIGFGDISASKDWTLSKSITIRPKKWKEPREIVINCGMQPNLGNGNDLINSPNSSNRIMIEGSSTSEVDMNRQGSGTWSEEDYKKEAYRQKGRDVVGSSGTFRFSEIGSGNSNISSDLPPPFEGNDHSSSKNHIEAGPSSRGDSINEPTQHGNNSELPTFLESEEQARTGEIPLLNEAVRSERLVPVNFDQDSRSVVIPDEDDTPQLRDGEDFDRNNWVGRRGSLGGELGTWVEYDGYETFSVAPPSMDASYGAGGSMDPPQEGDENNVNLVDGMAARLGLDGEGAGMQGLELMEHLGLGEGTRVVDLQDDLPPGIDEPSLPALPDFNSHTHSHPHPHQIPDPHSSPPPAHAPYISPPAHSEDLPPAHDPPSFDASQAANAVGGVATSHIRSSTNPIVGLTGRRPSRHAIDDAVGVGNVTHQGDAPPGYERAGGEGGLPPYS